MIFFAATSGPANIGCENIKIDETIIKLVISLKSLLILNFLIKQKIIIGVQLKKGKDKKFKSLPRSKLK